MYLFNYWDRTNIIYLSISLSISSRDSKEQLWGGKFEIRTVNQQAANSHRISMLQSWGKNSFFGRKLQFLLWRHSTNWMNPTHNKEDNLPYPISRHLVLSKVSTETSGPCQKAIEIDSIRNAHKYNWSMPNGPWYFILSKTPTLRKHSQVQVAHKVY